MQKYSFRDMGEMEGMRRPNQTEERSKEFFKKDIICVMKNKWDALNCVVNMLQKFSISGKCI